MNSFTFIVYAFKGLILLIKTETNIRVHLFVTIMAIGTGILLKVSATEWMYIILCSGFVIGLEAMNTTIERLCDFVYPQHHPIIGQIKDISAAAVLIASITSMIIGSIIFLPHLLSQFV